LHWHESLEFRPPATSQERRSQEIVSPLSILMVRRKRRHHRTHRLHNYSHILHFGNAPRDNCARIDVRISTVAMGAAVSTHMNCRFEPVRFSRVCAQPTQSTVAFIMRTTHSGIIAIILSAVTSLLFPMIVAVCGVVSDRELVLCWNCVCSRSSITINSELRLRRWSGSVCVEDLYGNCIRSPVWCCNRANRHGWGQCFVQSAGCRNAWSICLVDCFSEYAGSVGGLLERCAHDVDWCSHWPPVSSCGRILHWPRRRFSIPSPSCVETILKTIPIRDEGYWLLVS